MPAGKDVFDSKKEILALKKRVSALEQQINVSTESIQDVAETTEEQIIEKPKKADNVEENLGLKWVGYIGVMSLIFGVVFFLSTPQHDAFGFLGRIITGILASVIIIVFGLYLNKKKQYVVFSRILLGGGFASMYYSVFVLYHMSAYREATGINLLANILLLTIVIICMIWVALKNDSLTIFSEAYLLGYLTAILSKDTSIYTLVYSLLLTLSLVFIIYRKQWTWVAIPSVVLNQIVFRIWFLENFKGNEYFAVGFQIFYLALFIFMARISRNYSITATVDILNCVLAYFSLVDVFVQWHYFSFKDHGSIVTLVFALFYFLLSRKWKGAIYLFASLCFLGIAIALEFKSEYISILWMALFLITALFNIRTKDNALRAFSILLGLTVLCKLIFYDASQLKDLTALGISWRMLNHLLGAAAFFALTWIFKKSKAENVFLGNNSANICSIVGATLLFLIVPHEYKKHIITIIWGVYSIILIISGFIFKHRMFRIIGLIFLAITLIKAYLIDIFSLDTATRTIMFVILGFTLLAGSFAYARFKDKIREVV